ncbi:hypothetical protein DPMN_150865 [Dreissena polymorpha]|uniref:Ig-like domain-containing protein n=1 Tax=Dreissena polymorpha TaxID=45954 RepID=A0A9D4J6R2_DREPO|nr:hypothetical protein DPMN_150865 [Dreissena polymorpha]
MGNTDVTVYENRPAQSIVCYVDSNPGSAITLLKDGILVKKTVNSHELESPLRNYCNDSGVYTCLSVNDYNTDGASIKNISFHVECK